MRPLLPLLFALAACKDKGDDTAAEGPGTLAVSQVEATVSEVVTTVVTVRWTTAEAVSCSVEYGEDFALATPADAATTDHEAVLLGLPAETEVPFRFVAGSELSGTFSVTTGALPGDLPPITVEGDGNTHWMAVPIIGSVTAPVILSPVGKVVWYWLDDTGLDVYRVRPSVDGRSILFNSASVSGDPAEDSAIVRISLDGTAVDSVPVPLLAHDFVEHSDGTIGAIVVEYREVEGEEIRGDSIVEVAPDGTLTTIWSAWDCFDPATDWGDDSDFGWTFANALDFDEDEQAYILGIRNFSSIVRVERATGTCTWGFGGVAGTVEVEGNAFLHQHQFQVDEDALTVFDNDGAAGNVSRVIAYDVDWEAGTASEAWTYTADPTVYSFVLGDVRRFEDDELIVTWSVGGQIDRVAPDGQPTWHANLGIGGAFGFDTVFDSLY